MDGVRDPEGAGREHRKRGVSNRAKLAWEVGTPMGGARTGAGVFYSARVSSVAQRLETRPCWSNN